MFAASFYDLLSARGHRFFDDFEDEAINTAPVITSPNDVGLSWVPVSGTPTLASRVESRTVGSVTNRALNLGRSSANGAFDAGSIGSFVATAKIGTTITFDVDVDFTNLGSTFASVIGKNGSTTLFDFRFTRGRGNAGGLRLQNNVGGTVSDIAGLNLNNLEEWRFVTVALEESGYNITVTGTDGPYSNSSLIPYFSGSAPTTFDSLEFYDTANSNARNFFIDNITVTAVPEPSSISLFGLGSLALFLRRKR